MDYAVLRRTGARKVDVKVPVRGFSEKQLKFVNRSGGFGYYHDKAGRPTGAIMPYYDPEQKKKKIAIYKTPPSKVKESGVPQEVKEERDFLEELMEFDIAGHKRRQKPSSAKREKKTLHDWVEAGRPVQGVDA